MHAIFFTLNILVIATLPSCDVNGSTSSRSRDVTKSDNSTDRSVTVARPQSGCNNVLGWITIVIYAAFKLTNELQKVYLLYGLIRSPLYSTLAS